jgi:hypothetical protein
MVCEEETHEGVLLFDERGRDTEKLRDEIDRLECYERAILKKYLETYV